MPLNVHNEYELPQLKQGKDPLCEIEVGVDTTELDVAISKAETLVGLLLNAQKLIRELAMFDTAI